MNVIVGWSLNVRKMPCVVCSSHVNRDRLVGRHAVEHRARDVRDEIAERIDLDHFAFNVIGHFLYLRPGDFHELRRGRPKLSATSPSSAGPQPAP